jgi:hypothetical protein
VAGGKRRGVACNNTHSQKGGDSFCYRLIFYIIADEQNTLAQKAASAASFFPHFGVSAFDTLGLRQKIIASPASDVI